MKSLDGADLFTVPVVSYGNFNSLDCGHCTPSPGRGLMPFKGLKFTYRLHNPHGRRAGRIQPSRPDLPSTNGRGRTVPAFIGFGISTLVSLNANARTKLRRVHRAGCYLIRPSLWQMKHFSAIPSLPAVMQRRVYLRLLSGKV